MAWGLGTLASPPTQPAGWTSSAPPSSAFQAANAPVSAQLDRQQQQLLARIGLLGANNSGASGGGGGGGGGAMDALQSQSYDVDEATLRSLFPQYDQLVALSNQLYGSQVAQADTQYGSDKRTFSSDATQRGATTAYGTKATFADLLASLGQNKDQSNISNQQRLIDLANRRGQTQNQLDQLAINRAKLAAGGGGGGGGGSGSAWSASDLTALWGLQDKLDDVLYNKAQVEAQNASGSYPIPPSGGGGTWNGFNAPGAGNYASAWG